MPLIALTVLLVVASIGSAAATIYVISVLRSTPGLASRHPVSICNTVRFD